MNNKRPLDLSVLKAYSTEPEDIKLFVDVFIRQTSSDLEKLGRECTPGPNRNWLEICHKIKGAAAMAGAEALYSLCTEAEDLVDVTREARQRMFNALQAAFMDVSDRLRRAAA